MENLRRFMFTGLLMLVAAISGCGGGGGSTPAGGTTPGENSVATAIRNSAPLSSCPTGGISVDAGVDDNGNGILDTAEVDSTQYVCNGTNGTNGTSGTSGTNGTDGLSVLVSLVDEAAGTNCASGGKKVTAGSDANKNTILDPSEVTSTGYACNGITGTAGPAGSTGTTGPAGPGVTWVDVTGTSVQAASNTGYMADNASQVTITLPASPAVGDVVQVSGIGSGGWKIAQNAGQSIIAKGIAGSIGAAWMPRDAVRGWQSVASSSDGTKLVAAVNGGQLYVSVNSGVTWAARDTSRFWLSVVSSADGTKLVALVNGGSSYISADSGLSWTPMAAGGEAVALSMDGVNLVIAHPLAGIYQTFDAGATWAYTNILNVKTLASSADGTKLVAGAFGGNIYTSVDSGVTWTARDSARNWLSVASSSDGTKLVAGVFGGNIYTSVDSGATWTARDAARNWQSVASSADGTKLVAAVNWGVLYTSVDSGVTWTARDAARNWQSVASSADGIKLVAAVMSGNIYTSTPEISPNSIVSTSVGITGSLSGGQYDAVDLQCVDVNTFMVRSYAGYLTVQ